ncbi:MAG: UMP kinase [Calditrichaeota bacterium]|nr:UMP kinase [Calditrichota bacterium]MBT7787952.1 UMP kinase [Calditrichota bacterium]
MSFSQYKRVLLKLSGDILKGNEKSGIDFNLVGRIAEEIKRVSSSGIEVCIVVGGGNLFRGSEAEKIGYDRIIADNMGMLSTVINAMAIQNALENTGIQSRVMSAIGIQELVEPFIRRRAIRHLEKKRVVVFAAGTGNPYFTTDTAAALRATQVSADIILKGTKVDGVYDRDPKLDTEAIRFGEIDYMKVISQGLKVMDLTAITFCQDNKIPICVFDLTEEGNLWRVISGEKIGTMVKEIQE